MIFCESNEVEGFAANKINVRSVYKVYKNGYLCKFDLLNLGKICSEMKIIKISSTT